MRRCAYPIGVFFQRGLDPPGDILAAPALGHLNVCVWQAALVRLPEPEAEDTTAIT
jgi:hypothetical protein